MAESQGFEPWVPLKGTHDFQSCALDHSANSPCEWCYIIIANLRMKVKLFFGEVPVLFPLKF